MAKTKATHAKVVFEVQGSGEFPLDMLRYDNCVPYTGSDSTSIKDDERAQRVVKLCRFFIVGGRKEPEMRRWESFGWRIKHIFEEEI